MDTGPPYRPLYQKTTPLRTTQIGNCRRIGTHPCKYSCNGHIVYSGTTAKLDFDGIGIEASSEGAGGAAGAGAGAGAGAKPKSKRIYRKKISMTDVEAAEYKEQQEQQRHERRSSKRRRDREANKDEKPET